MKRYCAGLVAALLFFMFCNCRCYATDYIYNIQDIPAWLEGTLMISTVGSDGFLDSKSIPTDQYICAFNFSNKTIDTIRVPAHGRLMKYNDNTIVLYRKNGLYGVQEAADREGVYRTYFAEEVNEKLKGYTLQANICPDGVGEFTFSVNPLVVYGVMGEGSYYFMEEGFRTYYYLGYGVSNKGELEYQLVSESTTGEKKIYAHYPLDYFPIDIHVAISSNGSFAWSESTNDGEKVVYALINGKKVLLEDKLAVDDVICWLDDSRLLYTAIDYDINDSPLEKVLSFAIRVWNVETGNIEDMNESWGKDVMLPHFPRSIAVDRDKHLMAVYSSPSYFDSDRTGEIIIVDLNNGETCIFKPWQQSENSNNNLIEGYFKDDNGTIIFAPGDLIDAQIVWDN